LVRQVGTGPGEQVEHHEFFLCEVLADVALLLVGESPGQLQQVSEELLDLHRAGVVRLDQRLELHAEVDPCLVGGDEPVELRADRSLEPLDVEVLRLGSLELGSQPLKSMRDRSIAGGPSRVVIAAPAIERSSTTPIRRRTSVTSVFSGAVSARIRSARAATVDIRTANSEACL
jgi:hypothetical protein